MKIAITGSDGFVGTWLKNYLCKNHEIYELHHYEVDLMDFNTTYEVFKSINPDAIIHLAAQSSPFIAWKKPYTTVVDNVTLAINALRVAEKLKCKLILAGSSEVYDVIPNTITEESELNPRNPYDLSKLTVDSLVRLIAKERKINVTLLRLFNHIGPGQSDNFVVSTFSKQLAEIRLGLKEPVIMVGNLEAKRDLIDCRDAIKAYELFLDIEEFGNYYNVCSGKAYKIQWILDKLIEISGLNVIIQQDENRMRLSDIPIFVGDYSKIKAIGWEPKIEIETTLKDTYEDWLIKLSHKEV